MLLRKLVVLIGCLGVVFGLFQVSLPRNAEVFLRHATAGKQIYIFAALALLVGYILILAAIRKTVRISNFVCLIGLLTILTGAGIALFSSSAHIALNNLHFSHLDVFRMNVMRNGGLLRICVGIALIYAGIRPPARRTPRLGSIVPLG